MQNILLLCLIALSVTTIPTCAVPDFFVRNKLGQNLSRGIWPKSWRHSPVLEKRDDDNGINQNPDGSPFLWLTQDTYSGATFFDRWDFFTGDDPTNGTVSYVNQTTALEKKYIFVDDNGKAIMKADDTSTLLTGVNRESVRITSQTKYNTGLFILDINRAPWGCGAWPAFWTLGDDWPNNGEIDILEGVHQNQYNQIAWHTSSGCLLDPNATFTGRLPSNNTNCDGNLNSNSGCDVVEWSRASYGQFFESQGGGVLAMKWDENDISIWSFFRAAIPQDVADGKPNPSLWGPPSAILKNTMCDIPKYFVNHSIVFDITFCGYWAGNSYATSGCTGTCPETLMDPKNFENATWNINSLTVFRKELLTGKVPTSTASASLHYASRGTQLLFGLLSAVLLFCFDSSYFYLLQ